MREFGRGTRLLLRSAVVATAVVVATTPLAAASSGHHPRVTKSGPVSVAYVEVNNNAMENVGKYTLSDGSPVFDVAVIFAANINYDGANAYLYFNPQVQSVLDNAATTIRPLQQKGIKVVLSVLGNHEGAGFANFPSQQAASAFAGQLLTYNLGGGDQHDYLSSFTRELYGSDAAYTG